MKRILSLYLLSIGLLCSFQSSAQTRYLTQGLYSFAWDITVPLNNKDFISRTSTYGAKVEGRYFINPHFSVGGEINWSSLYEYTPQATYSFDQLAVTTDLYRYMYNLPFAVNAHYYLSTDQMIMPYAGLALGGMYSEQEIYFNIYSLQDNSWSFLVRPEAGALIKFGHDSQAAALIGVRYSYASGERTEFNISKIKTLSFQLGIALLN
jgi:hypothetical protein